MNFINKIILCLNAGLLIAIVSYSIYCNYYYNVETEEEGSIEEIGRIALNSAWMTLRIRKLIEENKLSEAKEFIDIIIQSDLVYVDYFDEYLIDDDNYQRLKKKMMPRLRAWSDANDARGKTKTKNH